MAHPEAVIFADVVVVGAPGPQHADVRVERGIIAAIGRGLPRTGAQVVEGRGHLLAPGFVDCHTHACWAGDRFDEWDAIRRGVRYLDILKAGGGIMSTVRAVRSAGEEELGSRLLERLNTMLRHGATTIEVKSGYGLTTVDEIKMLRAIRRAAASFRGTIISTALLGHALDPAVERSQYVRTVIHETLPAVSAEFPGIAIDAYCESNSWSLDECISLFEAAQERGHPIRVHADQFTSQGMVEWAIQHRALSIDHLEATAPAEARHFASDASDGGTHAVLLPACGFHLDGRYANGRALLDAMGNQPRLALATNCNPGSAPCFSMPMVIALAVRHCGLSVHEALRAASRTPAELLGFSDRGRIEIGRRADLILLNCQSELEVGYWFGGNPVRVVMAAGEIVHQDRMQN